MKKILFLVLVLTGVENTSCVTHSLRYTYIGTHGITDFPGFIATGTVDDFPIMHYDSNRRSTEPRQEWMKTNLGPDYWNSETATSQNQEELVKEDVKIAMRRYNQSEGVHTIQLMYGCELDDNGVTKGFMQYGYDGEDHISLDLKTMTWTAAAKMALSTENEWNKDGARNAHLSDYFNRECIEWLKRFVEYGRSKVERKVPPEVSVFQKGSVVTCHVTGFYPRGIMVYWERDGEEVFEDVELGETLPNDDGTFQTWSNLRASPDQRGGHVYTCRVGHSSVEELITKTISLEGIRGSSDPPLGIIIGCVVALLILVAVIGVIVWKKNKSGYKETRSSDTDSDNSEYSAQKA